MDMLKVFEKAGYKDIVSIHDYPKYNFRKEGEFFYSLTIQREAATDINDRICEIVFGENDLIDFIMRAEMALRLNDYKN